MPLLKTWKVLPKAPANFIKAFPEYPETILNLLFHRVGETKKKIDEFFNPNYEKDIHDPFLLSGMGEAVKRIKKAIKNKEKIAIFGDYDVDGITSTALISETLEKLGNKPLVYIPNRSSEGYGLNLKATKYLLSKKINLIITVDCGIRNITEAEKIKEGGMDLIITDHHLPGEELPPAIAIINPHQKNDKYPFKELAGVGVAFKLVCAIIKSYPLKFFEKGFDKWLLDLVSLGTIADMVPLVGENRTLVKFGLIVLGKTRRVGIQSIFELARLNLTDNMPPSSGQISFQIAPRLNASGRMDHANTSYALIQAKDKKIAQELAQELEKKNSHRQRITDKVVKEVEAKMNLKNKIIFEGDPSWPIGILGLAAGKICEKYAHPTFIYNSKKNKRRGSIRSIKNFKVVSALEKCKDLLLQYGGHDYAGGFTFQKKNEAKLKKRLKKIGEEEIKEEDLSWEIQIDQRVKLGEITWELNNNIKKMEPFGVGNSTPLFLCEGAELTSCQLVGNGNKHIKMWFKERDKNFEAIAFGKSDKYCLLIGKENPKLDIIFEVGSDEWNGQKKLQMIIRDMRLSPD